MGGDFIPGGQEGADSQSLRHLYLVPQGVAVVKEDKVGAVFPAHVSKIPGAQVPGEKDGGGQPPLQLLQLLLGKGLAAAGGGGEEEVLPPLFQGQSGAALAKAPQRLLQPPPEGAPGQGGGNHHPGVGGVGAVPLSDKQRPAQTCKLLVQVAGDLFQRGQTAFKVQNGPGEAPGLTLPNDFLTQRAGGAQSVEILVVHHHQPPLGRGAARPEQVGPRPQPVGQMGGGSLPAPEGGELPGRQGDDKGILWHGIIPLVRIFNL